MIQSARASSTMPGFRRSSCARSRSVKNSPRPRPAPAQRLGRGHVVPADGAGVAEHGVLDGGAFGHDALLRAVHVEKLIQ